MGIVRVSGKGLGALVQSLCGRELRPREATYLPFRDAQGQELTVATSGGVMVDQSKVIATDVAASNGVIHAIDTVLMPK